MKKINAQSFVAGRVYSVIYNSEVDMVGERDGKQNPLADIPVTVRRVSTIQAAGKVTWENFLARQGREKSSSNRAPWYVVSEQNDCIVLHKTNGTAYLRGLPRGVTKEQYFVGNEIATDAQVETIRAFKRSKPAAEFVVLKLDNLVNVDLVGELSPSQAAIESDRISA
jgi:hypothetical protein